MLRITLVARRKDEVVLKIEGWVSEQYVHVLEQEGDRWLQETGRLVLDLEGVRFIDDAGIALMQRWAGNGLELRGASPFIYALLEAHGLI